MCAQKISEICCVTKVCSDKTPLLDIENACFSMHFEFFISLIKLYVESKYNFYQIVNVNLILQLYGLEL